MVAAILKAVWRRVPIGLRRAFAHDVVMKFAPTLPEPAPGARDPDAPVIIVGFLTSASGLGQAARLIYRALERQGRNVYGVDLSSYFFETANVVDFAFRDGRSVTGPGRLIIKVNAPYLRYVFLLLGRRLLREKWVTGFWVWELPRVPTEWREGFKRVHDIIVPSRFVADAVRALGESPPIHVAPYPVALETFDPPRARNTPISTESPFTVAFAFNAASGFERKNPVALIEAYRRAFAGREDARLQILATNIEHYPEGRRQLEIAAQRLKGVELTFSTLDRSEYKTWLGCPDIYASLHRAEGFGLTLAEAMCFGIPVMATNWSANFEFMTEQNSLAVDYTLVPIFDPQRKYEDDAEVWADADVDHAASLFQRAFADRELLKRIADQAKTDALERFGSFSFGESP